MMRRAACQEIDLFHQRSGKELGSVPTLLASEVASARLSSEVPIDAHAIGESSSRGVIVIG